MSPAIDELAGGVGMVCASKGRSQVAVGALHDRLLSNLQDS